MLKLEALLKKYTEQLLYADDLVVKESLKSINGSIKIDLAAQCAVTYKKPHLKIATTNASLKNELVIKKPIILNNLRRDLGQSAPLDIRFN